MTFIVSAKTIHKKLLPALLAVCLILGATPADARRHVKRTAYNPPYAGIVMDADTGQILYSSNANAPLHPASLTKIMTLLMVFEALERDEIDLGDRVVMSRRAASMAPSKLGIDPGSSISVREAIYAVVTKSCNDVAVALAEKLAGSESAFSRKMTARAHELGMVSSTFTNASGLPDARQYSSAQDMARLARYVIATYPTYYKFYGTKDYYYRGMRLHNHNNLMTSYQGMDGMKTGYVYASGFNLVASAVRGDHRLIAVVFGGKTSNSRNAHVAKILDDGFNKLRSQSKTNAVLVVDNVIPAPPVPVAKPEAIAYAAPVPGRKPGILLAAATLKSGAAEVSARAQGIPNLLTGAIEPSAGSSSDQPETGHIIPAVLTQPDAELAAESEQETGLMQASLPSWAIQVGAFSSRAATDKALQDSLKRLPVKYASVNPMIAPLKTDDGWVFRARLHGLSRSEAFSACKYLSECVPVAPRNN